MFTGNTGVSVGWKLPLASGQSYFQGACFLFGGTTLQSTWVLNEKNMRNHIHWQSRQSTILSWISIFFTKSSSHRGWKNSSRCDRCQMIIPPKGRVSKIREVSLENTSFNKMSIWHGSKKHGLWNQIVSIYRLAPKQSELFPWQVTRTPAETMQKRGTCWLWPQLPEQHIMHGLQLCSAIRPLSPEVSDGGAPQCKSMCRTDHSAFLGRLFHSTPAVLCGHWLLLGSQPHIPWLEKKRGPTSPGHRWKKSLWNSDWPGLRHMFMLPTNFHDQETRCFNSPSLGQTSHFL